jgi:hypothetical protein
MLMGGLAAPCHEPSPAGYSYLHVSGNDRSNVEDDDESMVAWPVLGLSAGVVVGAGVSRIHLAVRRACRGGADAHSTPSQTQKPNA